MKNRYQERMERLRELMREREIDYYLIPTADYHNSEYIHEYFKVREYLTGFTGSNGTLIVSAKEACMWTDGRYFIQAEQELGGTDVILMRDGQKEVLRIYEYLRENMAEGQTLGFDGRVMTLQMGLLLEKELKEKKIILNASEDLSSFLFDNRPRFPCNEIWALDEELAGKSISEKVEEVRQALKDEMCDVSVISKLDDVMWLYNVRGSDVTCNPVALSYGIVTMNQVYFFAQKKAITDSAEEALESAGVIIYEYDNFYEMLEQLLDPEVKVQISKQDVSYYLGKQIMEKAKHCFFKNPTELLKACKNETELKYIREIYIRDSVAVTKFIYWLKKEMEKEECVLTECTAAERMDQLRSQTDDFLDVSFPTISAYQENAAMMHYEATPETCRELKVEGMLLVDSGGQYMGGTTDVTRTMVLGEISKDVKSHFTSVAMGMLRLSAAVFLDGCTGRNLDILARQPIWEKYMDYKCGTGHGIGYILNVHEGPHRIAWQYRKGMEEAILTKGMLVTVEPGIYLEGKYGIRTENVLAVREVEENPDGKFLAFETLTYVPIDLDGIDPGEMEKKDKIMLNNYHKKVFEKIAPFLSDNEVKWLKDATRPLDL